MTTKNTLLQLLEQHRGKYISGEEIANSLSVSRTAIWKAIKTLQAQGYIIEASTNRGYKLSETCDILSVQGIQTYLSPNCKNLQIEVLPQTTSTNTLVKEKASSGKQEGYVLFAQKQTAGRGRMNRKFFSPEDSGIYVSILLRPVGHFAQNPSILTCLTAVAVCEAIQQLWHKSAQIKWVNDIFMDSKKICGILTEASFSLENHQIDWVVIGAGINLYPPKGGFPPELSDIATSILEKSCGNGKNQMAAAFLNQLMLHYYHSTPEEIIQKYRQYNCVIGKQVNILLPNQQNITVLAKDITSNGHLQIEYPDGTQEVIAAGEVSLRF